MQKEIIIWKPHNNLLSNYLIHMKEDEVNYSVDINLLEII